MENEYIDNRQILRFDGRYVEIIPTSDGKFTVSTFLQNGLYLTSERVYSSHLGALRSAHDFLNY